MLQYFILRNLHFFTLTHKVPSINVLNTYLYFEVRVAPEGRAKTSQVFKTPKSQVALSTHQQTQCLDFFYFISCGIDTNKYA